MLFNSIEFLLFFPIVTLVYFVIPRKFKQVWLLIASYYFYMSWNVEYALLIFTSTLITFITGLLIEAVKTSKQNINQKQRIKKIIMFLSFGFNLGILFYFKYTNFALSMLGTIMLKFGIAIQIPYFDIVLPVGISFYTFQALGYTMDVYRDDIYAEKNFIKYALFVSFFPQLVAGPIERSKNLLKQLAEPKKFSFENAREGLLLILWGLFLKIVLADRIAIFVDTVYEDYVSFPGTYLILATIFFAIQIYCDFSGYSIIAKGAAKVMGIELMENFDAPYMSTSVAEFWRKWHISLTSWFKDYLYIPLGGSRKGKVRKYINKMIVFLVSGLWHGASWSFVAWGGLNGFYQIIGEILVPIRKKLIDILHLNEDSIGHRILRMTATFVFVDFSWIFFRANSLQKSFEIIKSMLTVYNPWVLFDGEIYNCGLDIKNYWLMIFSIGVLIFADYQKHKEIKIRDIICSQDYWVRWLIIDITVIALIVYGIWGSAYDAASFIYFQF